MKRFLIFYLLVILVSMFLSSCVSTKQRARNLVSRGYNLIEKGIKLDPSVADSVKGVREIDVSVPGDSGTVIIKPVIDSGAHLSAMGRYDSAVLANDSLRRLIELGNLTDLALESALAAKRRTEAELNKQRERFKNAFLKDSVYTFPDSLVDIRVHIWNGGVEGVSYKMHPRNVTTEVETTSVTLDGTRVVPMWKQQWFWFMACLILVLLLIILVMSKR